MGDLLLAVEVTSPSTSLLEHQRKRELYLREGVTEYWIISPDAQNVSRWRGRDEPGEVLSSRIEWQPAGMPTPFVLDLPEFFAEAYA